ncbi:molecular chaperone GrpE [Herbinix hemicellulosilytica]|uniref:Protein GrpE n=2 Tax=Herbinix hemicellulosilytica TaxID=1564487 RepID=A0A0H5SV94_HERHM|nr:nucleotide exchange factor GrpE [Herbinix hemicellulosilytica]RBP60561.1 molecular chaperone GrpE [Herbinix hemicellulosilytica]CRZ34248.1 hypothetical protein HHT355_1046 [Herbinix hemicellulosilytica]
MDKTVEVVKAAMEKEQKGKQASDIMDEKIDNVTENNTYDNEEILQNKEAMDNEAKNDDLKNQADNTDQTNEAPSQEETANETAAEGSFKNKAAEDEQEISEEDDSDSEGEKEAKTKKSLFKGAKNKELEAKDQKIQELTDKILRIMAEFDNYRKRTEKEKAQMFDMGVKSVIEKLLPVVDNFERGLGAVDEANKDNAIVQGFNMIYKQLMTMLDDIGVKPIEAVGKPFDPNFHNAVMHSEDENYGENIVAEEFQKGYMYNDMVVRHSMVRVVN